MTDARLAAQQAQKQRLSTLTPRCPCGEQPWPCGCPVLGGCVAKYSEASWRDQFAHLLPAQPVFFDEGK